VDQITECIFLCNPIQGHTQRDSQGFTEAGHSHVTPKCDENTELNLKKQEATRVRIALQYMSSTDVVFSESKKGITL